MHPCVSVLFSFLYVPFHTRTRARRRRFEPASFLPKSLEAELTAEQPELERSVLAEVIRKSGCWNAQERPLTLLLANKVYFSETIHRVSCSLTGKGPTFKDFVKVCSRFCLTLCDLV